MEKLTEEQRLKVSRMSDERLRGKLINTGYKEDDIARLDRPRLLVLYAQVLLAETAYVAGDDLNKGVDVAEGDFGTEAEEQADASGGMSLEERRLRLEERKLEEQRLQRQLDERRWQEEREERRRQHQGSSRTGTPFPFFFYTTGTSYPLFFSVYSNCYLLQANFVESDKAYFSVQFYTKTAVVN